MRAWTGHEQKPASMSPCLRRSRRVFAAPRRRDRARPSGAWSARVDGHEQSRRVFAALAASSPRLVDQESPLSSPRKPRVGRGLYTCSGARAHACSVRFHRMHVRARAHHEKGSLKDWEDYPRLGVGMGGRKGREGKGSILATTSWSFDPHLPRVRRSGGKVPT